MRALTAVVLLVLLLSGCRGTIGGTQGTPEFKAYIGRSPETEKERADDDACAQDVRKGDVAAASAVTVVAPFTALFLPNRSVLAYRECIRGRGYTPAFQP